MAQGVEGSLGAVGKVELAEDVADVGADGAFADNKLVGDGDVGEATGDEPQDFDFTRGEGVAGEGFVFGNGFVDFLNDFEGDGGVEGAVSYTHLPSPRDPE